MAHNYARLMRWVVVSLRSLLTWITGVLATIVFGGSVLVVGIINDTAPVIERLIHMWSRSWLVASGTRLTVEGQENIDPTRSYVVVSNHLSTLDIMTCLLAVRLPIRFLAKKELFRIPLLAQAMRAVGMVEVDRSAHAAIHAQVNRQAKELIAKKRSLIIYPEGTRPRDGVMKSFKKGAFTMAVASQLPVLPMSIHGSYEACPPGKPWFFGGPVHMIIYPPIETVGMDHSDTGSLRDEVHQLIAKRVADMGGKVG